MKQVKVKRVLSVLAALLLLAAAMTGCMRQDESEQSAQPEATPDVMPRGATADSGADTAAPQQRYDWTANAAQVEARIGQISEIAEARVVVAGDTALVGVKFDQAYQGELTERIREMVAAEVMAADPQITTVAVTADDEDVARVYEFADRSLAGRALDDLREDVNEVVRNATTLR